MPLSPGTRIGAYEILSALGKGGMGEVYRARDLKLKREVAIKVLPDAVAKDEERLSRLTREAQILASLNHPHIAGIHGLEESDDVRALVLELVEGDTLADRIALGPIPVDEALSFARQIASALQAAHEQGIVHRDLKPSNIKLRDDGTVKVLDFGLAKALPSAGGRPTATESPTITSPAVTQAGTILGTAAYMSPEQAKGRAADKRSDIWAFGCVLYEMLTGRRAYEAEDVAETLAFVLSRDPDWSRLPTHLSPSIRALLRRCLSRDARARVADAATVLFVLEEHGTLTTGSPQPPRASRWRLVGVGVCGLVAGSGIAAVAMWPRLSSDSSPVTRTAVVASAPAVPVFEGTDRSLLITPDGNRLVYVGNEGTQVFVRPLDALVPVPIVTTAALVRGVFSAPDGQSIGYVENNFTVKKVSVTGGPPATLMTMDGPSRGAAWAMDGSIVFATGASDTGLQQLPTNGGAVKVLTRPDRAAGEADHVFPVWLPGDRGVLFTILAIRGGLDAAKVAVLDPGTGTSKTIINGGHHARYVSSGHIAYAASGALRTVAFDLSTLEARGTPVEAVSRIAAGGIGGVADFDVSTRGTLAYLAPTDRGGLERTIVWVDRRGLETPLALGPSDYSHPRLSPDGRRLVVRAENDLHMVDLTRASPALTRLTFAPEIDWFPVWMPDSRRLVFGSWRGGGFSNLYVQSTEGGGTADRITESPDMQLPTGVTPDGTKVIFHRVPLNMQAVAFSPPHEVDTLVDTPFEERNGVVSPDGRSLAYEGESAARPGRVDIYVRPFPSVEERLIQVSTGGGMHPVWARSGDELFYRSQDGTVMAVPVESSATTVSAGTAVRLFQGPYVLRGADLGRNYDVSLDGRRFLMIKAEEGDSRSLPPHIVIVQRWADELRRRPVP